MGFWNEYNTDLGVVMDELNDALEAAKKKREAEAGGGGATSAKTTPSGGLRVDSQNSRDKDIAALSETRIQVALKMGILTEAEVDRVKGAGYTARLADNPWGAAENKIQAEWTANPPAFFRSTLDSSESPTQALKGLSTVSGEPYGNGPQVNGAGGYTGPGTTGSAGGGAKTGGGGSSAAATPATPPAPNSLLDLANRGAMRVGQNVLLNGQQYRRPGAGQVKVGEQWFNTDQQGRPQGAGFKSEEAARLAEVYANGGAAIESRFGNSPTAKAAGSGGFQQTVQNPLFPLIGPDQSIAASATKGQQTGDILGTISNNTGNFYDITQGGISAGGGLTPVGNSMNPYDSFTGQMANGDSIGMSSILGNNGVNTQYWLSQMSGLPPSEIAKLKIDTPQEALQFQQAVETARAQGMMPNFASLFATYEPLTSSTGGMGHPGLKWGGGASNTPYDKAFAGFADYALGSPDLTYFPEQGYGSTQIGNVAVANTGVDEWGNMLTYADGGKFTLGEPSTLVGNITGKPYALIAEAGKREKVTIEPTQEDIRMSDESMYDGFRPLQGGKPQRFAAGGDIYAGGQIYTGSSGFTNANPTPIRDNNGVVTDYGLMLGYKSDPLLFGGGATFNRDTRNNFLSPKISKTGQPVTASFEFMDPEQQNQFTNQGGRLGNQRIQPGPLTASPVGYQTFGGNVLPVYDQLNPSTSPTYEGVPSYISEQATGKVVGYDYVPMNVGGVPALVRVPQYNTPAPPDPEMMKQRNIASLTQLLDNNGVRGDAAMPGYNKFASRQDALSALYDLDPKLAMLYASQGGGAGTAPWGQTPGGDMTGVGRGTTQTDQEIENEATRRRQYDIQSRNYARAGLPSPTILDIPRQTWTPPEQGWGGSGGGSGGSSSNRPPWGAMEPPYQEYGRPVQNGYTLPFGYEPGSPWFNRGNLPMPPAPGGGTVPPPAPGGTPPWGQPPPGQTPQPGQNWTPWWNQLPDWIRGYMPTGAA